MNLAHTKIGAGTQLHAQGLVKFTRSRPRRAVGSTPDWERATRLHPAEPTSPNRSAAVAPAIRLGKLAFGLLSGWGFRNTYYS